MTEDVLFEELTGEHGDVGLITLNRPKVLNALNHAMFLALHKHLQEWSTKKNIKCVIIRAAEGRAFCAGGDIRYAYERGLANDPTLMDFFADEYRLNSLIHHYPKPYIALLDGITMGGGAGISIHASYRIATPKLLFAMPETGIGFYPDVGASYFLSRLPHAMGIYLGLTGARITSADAKALGLVDKIVESDELPDLIEMIRMTSFKNNNLGITDKPSSSSLFTHQTDIETCFNQPSVEAILAALEKCANPWCEETIKLLNTKSPTSLKVTLRQLQEGKNLDFDACMKMEYHLTNQFIQGPDFFEGVRAAIIDKDQKPRWKPGKLTEVTEHEVKKYFLS